jgi:hypothetical protein
MANLTLHLIEGSVAFPLSVETARELKAALDRLLAELKAVSQVTAGVRPTPKAPIEFRHVGEVFFELFCNPNIWSTPFAAKVLLTLRDDRIRLTTEAELSRVIDDVQEFLDQNT